MLALLFIFGFTSVVFLLSSHPMMLGFMLMVNSAVVGGVIFLSSQTPWFTYLLIIIFLSGMMVMFMYMASLVSNEKTNISLDYFLLLSSALFLAFAQCYLYLGSFSANSLVKNTVVSLFLSPTGQIMNKTYNMMSSEMTILMIVYLLVVLVVSMKLISFKKMPLRKK